MKTFEQLSNLYHKITKILKSKSLHYDKVMMSKKRSIFISSLVNF